jgi:DNA-directed RNA polymerase sigma subunit (sigma70/sigma32)
LVTQKKKEKNKKNLTKEEIQKIVEETGGDLTLQEIGDMYGVTRMRVCQIEKLSLQKLAEIADLKNMT